MKVLLDTNALLWAMADHPRIKPVSDLLVDQGNDVLVSAVSWWEIAIKTRIGKLDADLPTLRTACQRSGFAELTLTSGHAEVLASLPTHHNDPFDHMLLAQAIDESARLVTGDKILARYTPLVHLI